MNVMCLNVILTDYHNVLNKVSVSSWVLYCSWWHLYIVITVVCLTNAIYPPVVVQVDSLYLFVFVFDTFEWIHGHKNTFKIYCASWNKPTKSNGLCLSQPSSRVLFHIHQSAAALRLSELKDQLSRTQLKGRATSTHQHDLGRSPLSCHS